MSSLLLELARTVLFLFSPLRFRLIMISSMEVLSPHREDTIALPVMRFAPHKLVVSVHVVVGVKLLATTLANKHTTTALCCQSLCWLCVGKDLKVLSQTLHG